MSQLDAMLAQLLGQEIYGGCEDCEAYQTVEQESEGGWMIRVHHDDWCPFWTRMRERTPG
jgi:hypothetical protein